METKDQLPANNETQDTIFEDEQFTTGQYDKHIRQARNTIFFVAAAQLIFGTILAFAGPEEDKWASLAITILVSAIFTALGFWTKKKPYTAIVTALCLYVVLLVLNAFLEPESIIQGIIFKIIIIIFLAKGLGDAKEAQEMKKIRG